MPAEAKQRFWRKCRVYFRRTRITVWLLVLAVLGALVYLNQVGLPDFAKRPLLARLREQGVALEFQKLCLHWTQGFVADQVRFGAAAEPAAPQLIAREARIKLSLASLLRGRLQVDALGVQDGRLEWRPVATNAVLRALTVDNIQARLRFLPEDRWRLDDLRARFAGADFLVSANITNASAIRDWDFVKGPPGLPAGVASRWPERLQRLADTLEAISFAEPPVLTLVVEGDARVFSSFAFRLNLSAANADTPWGQAEQVELVSRLFPAGTNTSGRGEINLTAACATTRWATTTNLDVQLRLVALTPQSDRIDAALTLRSDGATTPWVEAGPTQLKAHWIHATTNPVPESGRIELATGHATTRWARANDLQVTLALAPATNQIAADASLAFWTNLLAYQLDWSARARAVKAADLVAQDVACDGQWQAPQLRVEKLHADLYRGALDGAAWLDVLTREAAFSVAADCDVKQMRPGTLFTGKAQEWLDQFAWTTPPRLQCAAAFVLPAWTNPAPDWLTDVRPTLRLAGELSATNSAFRGIAVDQVRSHFTYTNRTWDLPDFELSRPDGRLRLAHTANDATHDFYFCFHSTLSPEILRPLLSNGSREALDLCRFTAPPVLAGELWGNWRDCERIGFRGQVALTNFSLRGQFADAVVADVRYTNRVVEFLEPRIWSGTQHLAADAVVADFNAQRVYFTNGLATADPRFVTRAIGPMVDHVMEPYRFLSPPTARITGHAPMNDPNDADLRFEGAGGPFECLRFRLPQISGVVHWQGNRLVLTNLTADFYGGGAAGWALFTFEAGGAATFAFSARATNADLRFLMADLARDPNAALEGRLDLQLAVTEARTDRADSWNGFGRAGLADGLIWAIPIFGVLSQPLDAIMPGVGRSRISSATASFLITNSVVRSEDLKMRSPTMRLQYRGTVDFAGNVNARVTAEPLRDTPVLGPVVNLALWPVTRFFEYKITGTLAEPKSEPLYVPARILLIPLHPFQTLEELFPAPTLTNGVPHLETP